MWIWEHPDWPNLRYDASKLPFLLEEAAQAIGRLRGHLNALDSAAQEEAAYLALVADVVKSSEIEGEKLDPDSVRAELALRLDRPGPQGRYDSRIEGMIDVTLDATERAAVALTADRLKAWQAALFPPAEAFQRGVRLGEWRTDEHGPMRVVSGPLRRQVVHFEAPPASQLNPEVHRFLEWFEHCDEPLLVKAGLAHLWFVTLHPFDDGNGRIARAISDLVLSRFDGEPYRYYSLSAQMQVEQGAYYEALRVTQTQSTNVTRWLTWFLGCLRRAVARAEGDLEVVLAKARYRQRMATVPLTDRQQSALNQVLHDLSHPITNRAWASLTEGSSDTALRDISALIKAGLLVRLKGGGRAAAYWLSNVPLPEPTRDGRRSANQHPQR